MSSSVISFNSFKLLNTSVSELCIVTAEFVAVVSERSYLIAALANTSWHLSVIFSASSLYSLPKL